MGQGGIFLSPMYHVQCSAMCTIYNWLKVIQLNWNRMKGKNYVKFTVVWLNTGMFFLFRYILDEIQISTEIGMNNSKSASILIVHSGKSIIRQMYT